MKHIHTSIDKIKILFTSLGRLNNKINDKGFSIVEVLIAMVILSIGILALAKLQISAIKGNNSAMKFTQATTIAQQQIETLMTTSFDTITTAGTDTITNADGYVIVWTIVPRSDGASDDIDGDGIDDVKEINIIVNDPTGKRRADIRFIKAANI